MRERTFATTCASFPFSELTKPPLLVYPDMGNQLEWDLIGVTSSPTPDGKMHFWWFWQRFRGKHDA